MKRKYTLASAAAVILLAACLICDSRYNLQVTKYNLGFGSLPSEFEGFRILQLSDLHGARFGKENARLIETVRELEPDLIALTGDLAGSLRQIEAVSELLAGIEGIAPIYYVNGNHEWAGGVTQDMEQLMAEHGMHCLSNAYEPLHIGDAQIVVCGAEDPNGRADMTRPPQLAERLRAQYPEDFVLWLTHRNNYVQRYPSLPVELILCGHAHGGIVRLPGLGGLFSTSHTLGAEHEAGLYRGERFIMAVSRGLGNSIPVPRLFNRPEIVCITLSAG